MATTSELHEVSSRLEEELLRLFARQARRVPLPVFLAALLIVVMAYQGASHSTALNAALLAWLALVALVLALRRRQLPALAAQARLPLPLRLRRAVLLSALNGSVHSLSLAVFWMLPDLHRAIQSLLLLGLCAGAVATTGGYRPVFLAYVLPVLGTLATCWAGTSGGPGDSGWIGLSTALIIILFGLVLVSLASDSFRLLRESFNIRSEQAALNDQLQQALQRAESANRAKTRFLAAASHDLRQPLHTVSLFAAALALRPLDATSRSISGHIDEALHTLTAQLDALLDVSKLDAGVVAVTPQPLPVRAFAARLQAQFAPLAAAKGLALCLAIEAEPVLHTDAVLLGRVVGNLLDIAIKYSSAGTVSLAALACAGVVVLTVADQGRGIAPAEQDAVFEEFYQVDNPERDRSRGLGLGLAIVIRLVALLGARLEMVSQAGAGTSFYLIFPAATAPAWRAAAPAEVLNPLHGKHVLVVDDESAVRLGMQALLAGLGARVTLASGSAAALHCARHDPPDLLLADLRLRDGDTGIATVQALRRLQPQLAAILISGDTSPERLREAQQARLPLLHKPLPLALLIQAVSDLHVASNR